MPPRRLTRRRPRRRRWPPPLPLPLPVAAAPHWPPVPRPPPPVEPPGWRPLRPVERVDPAPGRGSPSSPLPLVGWLVPTTSPARPLTGPARPLSAAVPAPPSAAASRSARAQSRPSARSGRSGPCTGSRLVHRRRRREVRREPGLGCGVHVCGNGVRPHQPLVGLDRRVGVHEARGDRLERRLCVLNVLYGRVVLVVQDGALLLLLGQGALSARPATVSRSICDWLGAGPGRVVEVVAPAPDGLDNDTPRNPAITMARLIWARLRTVPRNSLHPRRKRNAWVVAKYACDRFGPVAADFVGVSSCARLTTTGRASYGARA